MSENITLDRYREATRRVGIETEESEFRVHAVAFVVANVMLALVNILLMPEFIWFYFATIGWGVGLTVHYFGGYRRRVEIADKKAIRIESLARKQFEREGE